MRAIGTGCFIMAAAFLLSGQNSGAATWCVAGFVFGIFDEVFRWVRPR